MAATTHAPEEDRRAHARHTARPGSSAATSIERLLADGHRVQGVHAFTDYYEPAHKRANLAAANRDERFELVEADLATADLRELVDGVDVVLHQAAQPRRTHALGRRVLGVHRVAGGASVRMLRLLRLLGEAIGSPVEIEHLPPQPGDVARTGASSRRLRAATGWRPRVSLADGIAAQVTWHRTQRDA